jgi:F-type H+-transporting ATPase subunit epsilon
MAEKLRLDIVTPHGAVFGGEVEEVTATGSEGEFGVLPGHAPLLTMLRIGVLTTKMDGKPLFFFVGGGYAEAGPEKVLIMADSAERAEDIDLARAMAAKQRAEERLRKQENVDYARAESQLERAVTRITIAQKLGGKG